MKKYRNEWKYCCNIRELTLLEYRLKNVLTLDPHTEKTGKYYVHSLYFDDYKNTCARDNDAGVATRFKWRIRYYGENYETIHLEYKTKKYGRSRKQQCPLTREEYQKIIEGDVTDLLWNTSEELLKKFCIAILTKHFQPKVIIDYERVAYIEPITNIRITLDTNITASFETNYFLTGKYQRYPVQSNQKHILEVKFDEILPSYIRNVVASFGFQQTSFSKYYLGRKRIEEVVK